MNKLSILFSSYRPNTAPTNRLLSFLKGLDELGVVVDVVFLYPNKTGDRLDTRAFQNITVSHLWERNCSLNKLVNYIHSFLLASRFARNLAPQSKVLLMGSSEYLSFFTKRKDLLVYQERTEHYNVVKVKPFFLQRRYLKSIPKLKGMFVISTALRDSYMNDVGAKRVTVVNMTVDANRFRGLKKEVVSEKYIAYCGTASNNKDGVDVLIKAFSIVHQSQPDVKLYIIGKSPTKDDSVDNLSLVEYFGLSEHVVFKGIIPSSQMPQMLVNAKIVALARPNSLQSKCGFPTKLGEYLLSGNPVVVTRVGDIPLFLEDGKSALLSDPSDPEGFAAKLLWVLEHEDEAVAVGKAGHDVALRSFNYKIESEKIVKTIFSEY